ncbi:hypothetical protein PRIPAC_92504 [Pristionchus pacificus]|uniref:Tyrosine phosphatase n=1 Tax=Pristionchus pacificus TaxID=54126 RepID=A0A2A6CDS1_PRIPA|nr:hypothetical protein PRIPAC_92504 [Pristionchus pacificus]|eukprot:PDM76240.1 tyrosine phosphatase [Pristionchus pacificus]
MPKPDSGKSAQQDVQGENLNDFVASLSAGGKLKQHAEHDGVRRAERQINKFTKYTDKNRFNNAVLFSQGSIDVQPEEKGDTTYIHASKIACPGGALIMAQAPMKTTLIDFYRLIWQQKVSTIVTLVNLENKEDCTPYFERKAGKKTTQRGRFRVRTVAVRAEGKNIVNYELKIENYLEKSQNKSRPLNVISVLGWEPDQPFDVKVIVAAIHNAEALNKIGPQLENGRSAPMLIHGCSGIRRTGVFALAFIFAKQIIIRREINLIGVIEQVRNVRYGVLRKKAMFFFLLEIIIALVAETGVVQPGSDDHLQTIASVKKMYAMELAEGEEGEKRKGRKKKSKGGKSKEPKTDRTEGKTGVEDEEDEEDDQNDCDKSVTGIQSEAVKRTPPKGKKRK